MLVLLGGAGLMLRRVLGLFWDYSGSGIDLSCRDEEASRIMRWIRMASLADTCSTTDAAKCGITGPSTGVPWLDHGCTHGAPGDGHWSGHWPGP